MSFLSDSLIYFHLLTQDHLRGLHEYQGNGGSEGKNEKLTH